MESSNGSQKVMNDQYQIRVVREKWSKVHNKKYKRVFLLGPDGKTYMTDLVPGFRNYAGWEPLLIEKRYITGVKIMDDVRGKLDADTIPNMVEAEEDLQQELF